MKMYNGKDRIGRWVRFYNRPQRETYTVESWPDDDSSKKNIDALCAATRRTALSLLSTPWSSPLQATKLMPTLCSRRSTRSSAWRSKRKPRLKVWKNS